MCIGQELFTLGSAKTEGIPRQVVRGWFMKVTSKTEVEFYSAFHKGGFGIRENAAPHMAAAEADWRPCSGEDVEIKTPCKGGSWVPSNDADFMRGEVVGWHVGYLPVEVDDSGTEFRQQLVPHFGVRINVGGSARTVHVRVGAPSPLGRPENLVGLSTLAAMKNLYESLKEAAPIGDELFFLLNDNRKFYWSQEVEDRARAHFIKPPDTNAARLEGDFAEIHRHWGRGESDDKPRV